MAVALALLALAEMLPVRLRVLRVPTAALLVTSRVEREATNQTLAVQAGLVPPLQAASGQEVPAF